MESRSRTKTGSSESADVTELQETKDDKRAGEERGNTAGREAATSGKQQPTKYGATSPKQTVSSGSTNQKAGTPSGSISGSWISDRDQQHQPVTIEEAMTQLGFGVFQLKMAALCGAQWMSDAMELVLISMLTPVLSCEWGITRMDEALVGVLTFSGMFLGALTYGTISDRYGRRAQFTMSTVFTFYFALLSTVVPNLSWLLLIRFLVGFNIGGASQAVGYLLEFVPAQDRLKAFTILAVFWTLGVTFEVALALLTLNALGWRLFLFFSALPQLFVFLGAILWAPESPRFLLLRRDTQKLKETLDRIAAENGTAPVERAIVKPSSTPGLGRHSNEVDSWQSSSDASFLDLFSEEYRVSTVLLWILWSAFNFLYYGFVLLSVGILQNPESGGACPIKVEEKAREEISTLAACMDCRAVDFNTYLRLFWTTLAEAPGLFAAVALTGLLGRKAALSLSLLVFTVSTATLLICSNRFLVLASVFVSRGAISGGDWITYPYTAELYPTSIRARGIGYAAAISRLFIILAPFVSYVFLDVSFYLTLVVFIATSILAMTVAIFLPHETRGRCLKETVSYNRDLTSLRK